MRTRLRPDPSLAVSSLEGLKEAARHFFTCAAFTSERWKDLRQYGQGNGFSFVSKEMNRVNVVQAENNGVHPYEYGDAWPDALI
jgi:hypothetical protein